MTQKEKKLLSVQSGEVTKYLFTKEPSVLVPFKGDFPIVPDFMMTDFYDQIHSHKYADECVNWVKEALIKGQKMFTIETRFIIYLQKEKEKTVEDFVKMTSKEKTELLKEFLENDCLTIESLSI